MEPPTVQVRLDLNQVGLANAMPDHRATVRGNLPAD
jgi:hypothetical protein